MKQSPRQVEMVRSKQAAQQQFLRLVAGGTRPGAAIRQVGRSPETLYSTWLYKNPDFAARYAVARAEGGTPAFQGIEFVRFRETYFEHKTPPHHARIIDAIETAPVGSTTLILGFPQSAKTTLLEDYINYKLGPVDPNYRIAMISAGQDLARDIVSHVGDRMTDQSISPAYISDYGPFRVDPKDKRRSGSYERDVRRPWNKNYFTILKKSGDEKEPSLSSFGAGSKLYGRRFDLIVFDDVQDQESLNDTAKLLAYFRLTARTRLDKDTGKIVVLATRVGPGDFGEALIEADIVNQVVTIPALVDERGQPANISAEEHFTKHRDRRGNIVITVNPDCAAKPAWDHFSLHDMAVIRHDVGEDNWSLTYMQRPVSRVGAAFVPADVKPCLDHDRVLGQGAGGLARVGSLDPALTGAAAFGVYDYTAEVLSLIDLEDHVGLGSNEAIFMVLARLAGAHATDDWVVEQDGQGNKALIADERLRQMASDMGFRVFPHLTTGNKSAWSFGVAQMPGAFKRREISLPYGDDRTRERVDMLCEQLYRWRPDIPVKLLRQDQVMQLWFAWRWWVDRRRVMNQTSSAFDREVPAGFQTGLAGITTLQRAAS